MLKYLALLFIPIVISCGGDENNLTFWVGGAPQEIEFWQNRVNEFNKIHNVNLKLVRQPTYSDQRRQGLVLSLESRQKDPDLFLMDVVWIDQFMRSDWLEPLDGNLSGSKLDQTIFFQETLETLDKLNDVIYALPVFMDVGLFYYRKDLLKKYGYNAPPETWKEMTKVALKIVREEKGLTGYVWQGAQYEGLVCTFIEFISSNGGDIVDEDNFVINSLRNYDALTFMKDLIYKYDLSPQNTYTEMKEEEVRRAFQRGNAVFERNWSYTWNLHEREGSEVKGKTGITLIPHFEGKKSAAALGGWHIGISKFSDRKNKAWKFIEYVTSYEFQKKMFVEIGWNPSRKDIYGDSSLITSMPHLLILEESFYNAVARPPLPYYPQASDIIQRKVNNVLANNLDPAAALKEMERELRELRARYGQ